jgi:hypothetical protein
MRENTFIKSGIEYSDATLFNHNICKLFTDNILKNCFKTCPKRVPKQQQPMPPTKNNETQTARRIFPVSWANSDAKEDIQGGYSDANTITDYTFQRQHFKKETATHTPNQIPPTKQQLEMGENTLVTSGIEYSDANTITDYTFQRQHFKKLFYNLSQTCSKATATHAPNQKQKKPQIARRIFPVSWAVIAGRKVNGRTETRLMVPDFGCWF